MSHGGSLLLAIGVAYGWASAVPLLWSRPGGRRGAWGLVPAVLLCPLLIPPANVGMILRTATGSIYAGQPRTVFAGVKSRF